VYGIEDDDDIVDGKSAYERQREARIARNEAYLESLGLGTAKPEPPKKRTRVKAAQAQIARGDVRRSTRTEGQEKVAYAESDTVGRARAAQPGSGRLRSCGTKFTCVASHSKEWQKIEQADEHTRRARRAFLREREELKRRAQQAADYAMPAAGAAASPKPAPRKAPNPHAARDNTIPDPCVPISFATSEACSELRRTALCAFCWTAEDGDSATAGRCGALSMPFYYPKHLISSLSNPPTQDSYGRRSLRYLEELDSAIPSLRRRPRWPRKST